MIKLLLSLFFAAATSFSGTLPTYALQSFDPQCGQPGYNCRAAFQAAFAALTQSGGGTLNLPPGTLFVDFPDIYQNYPGVSVPLMKSKLLMVPSNTAITGAVTATGAPNTTIQWSHSSSPIFLFAATSHSAMSNIHAQFIGTMPQYFPYGDVALLSALGYSPTYAHQNQMSGGNGEMFAFVYLFGSDHCTFTGMQFDSLTQDNTHVYAQAFTLKGSTVLTGTLSGLGSLSATNTISHVSLRDYVMGMLIAGQEGILIDHIDGDRRGSVPNSAAGHLVYFTTTNQYDASGNLIKALNSINSTITNISEGGSTYSNASSGGTLALKGMSGGSIANVTSSHPEGLIQTLYAVENLTFTNLTWQSSYDLCGNVPNNCQTPVIYSAFSSAPLIPISNLTFTNVTLSSAVTPITTLFMGANLAINGLTITTPPTYLPNQTATYGILGAKNVATGSVTGYTLYPVLTTYNPATPYNNPFEGWHPVSNVTAAVNIVWPAGVMQPLRTERIVSSGFQDSAVGSGNIVTTTVTFAQP